MVYGVLLESIKTAIIESFGLEVWTEITESIEFDTNELNPYGIYPEGIIPQIITCKNFDDLEIFLLVKYFYSFNNSTGPNSSNRHSGLVYAFFWSSICNFFFTIWF